MAILAALRIYLLTNMGARASLLAFGELCGTLIDISPSFALLCPKNTFLNSSATLPVRGVR